MFYFVAGIHLKPLPWQKIKYTTAETLNVSGKLFGIKQEALALELGDDWNQQRISLLEQKEEIADNILEEIAKVLKVPAEAIKNLMKQLL